MLPGLTPGDVRKGSLGSSAVYAELEQELSPDFVLTGAARFERFPTSLETTARLQTLRTVQTIRSRFRFAHHSTGLKAPHLAQSFTSTTTINFTNFVATTVRLLPVDKPSRVHWVPPI